MKDVRERNAVAAEIKAGNVSDRLKNRGLKSPDNNVSHVALRHAFDAGGL